MQTRVNLRDGLTYVWIPPGSFLMVSRPALDDEAVRNDLNSNNQAAALHNLHTEEGLVHVDDWPVLNFRPIAHRVTLTRGFWIGETPVTQEAYERVTGSNPSDCKGAGLPVQSVTWDEAKAYAEAIGMRLPTEAQWEYAARGGDASAPPDIDELAWHYGNSSTEIGAFGRERFIKHRWTPQSVRQKRPNDFRLYDMFGNVWEWVADCFWNNRDPESSTSRIDLLPPEMGPDLTDPDRAPAGPHRVSRGGSHLSPPEHISPSCRRIVEPDTKAVDIGFRCVGEFADPI